MLYRGLTDTDPTAYRSVLAATLAAAACRALRGGSPPGAALPAGRLPPLPQAGGTLSTRPRCPRPQDLAGSSSSRPGILHRAKIISYTTGRRVKNTGIMTTYAQCFTCCYRIKYSLDQYLGIGRSRSLRNPNN